MPQLKRSGVAAEAEEGEGFVGGVAGEFGGGEGGDLVTGLEAGEVNEAAAAEEIEIGQNGTGVAIGGGALEELIQRGLPLSDGADLYGQAFFG